MDDGGDEAWESVILAQQQAQPEPSVGFFGKLLGAITGAPEAPTETDPAVTGYWQNYDLEISSAPSLFDEREFDNLVIVKRALDALVFRARIHARISAKHKDRIEMVAVRIQSNIRVALAWKRYKKIKAIKEAEAKSRADIRQVKRELVGKGLQVKFFRVDDGTTLQAELRAHSSWDGLIFKTSKFKKPPYIPLIKLKECKNGYPEGFPSPALLSRGLKPPDIGRTVYIETRDGNGPTIFVCNTVEERVRTVNALTAIINELNSPDAFYFDASGTVRRITKSVFSKVANKAILERRARERERRFRERSEQLKLNEERKALRMTLQLKNLARRSIANQSTAVLETEQSALGAEGPRRSMWSMLGGGGGDNKGVQQDTKGLASTAALISGFLMGGRGGEGKDDAGDMQSVTSDAAPGSGPGSVTSSPGSAAGSPGKRDAIRKKLGAVKLLVPRRKKGQTTMVEGINTVTTVTSTIHELENEDENEDTVRKETITIETTSAAVMPSAQTSPRVTSDDIDNAIAVLRQEARHAQSNAQESNMGHSRAGSTISTESSGIAALSIRDNPQNTGVAVTMVSEEITTGTQPRQRQTLVVKPPPKLPSKKFSKPPIDESSEESESGEEDESGTSSEDSSEESD